MNEVEGGQLDMFEHALGEHSSTLGVVWSYSRRQVLEQCPRRYYYQYYTSAATRAMEETQRETLKFLKTLSNRYMWAGKVLHSLIRQYLIILREGREQKLESLLNRAKVTYRVGLDKASASKDDKQSRGLLEFYYGLADAEQLLGENEERLIAALTNFVTSSVFTPFIQGAMGPEVHTEDSIKLAIDHSRARGKIDLAYSEGGSIIIVDWKLGSPGNSDEGLQLSFYALWGVEAYQCLPQNISVSAAHLCDNLVAPVSISDNTLRQTKARILQDLEKMRMLDVYGKNAVEEAFSPCSLPLVCALCPFQAVCPKEP